MVVIWSQIIDVTLFIDPVRHMVMATNFGATFADKLISSTLVFQNRLKYWNIDERIGSTDYLCTNLMNFGPLTNPTDYDSTNCKVADYLHFCGH